MQPAAQNRVPRKATRGPVLPPRRGPEPRAQPLSWWGGGGGGQRSPTRRGPAAPATPSGSVQPLPRRTPPLPTALR